MPRLLALLIVAALSLLNALAAAQEVPHVEIVGALSFVLPRSVTARVKYSNYAAKNPPVFRLHDRDVAIPAKTAFRNLDGKYDLSFELKADPDGTEHRYTISVLASEAEGVTQLQSQVVSLTLPVQVGVAPWKEHVPSSSSLPEWTIPGGVVTGLLFAAYWVVQFVRSLFSSTETPTVVTTGGVVTEKKAQVRKKREKSRKSDDVEDLGTKPVSVVQLPQKPEPPPEPPPPPRPVRLFYSYSEKDDEFREALETHLTTLRRGGLIEEWHDRQIAAGEEWRGRVDEELEQAEVILLLVSSDFLASDYCYEVVLKRAIERHDSGEATVIPILLRPVDWASTPFEKLISPRDRKPISRGEDVDEAWVSAVQSIRRVIEARQKHVAARRTP